MLLARPASSKLTPGDHAAATKLCIHFCDAPAHGTLYTSLKDTYPGGDPEGETCEQYLKELGRKGVDFHFARITSHTDQMISVWKREVYEGNDGAFFEEHTVLSLTPRRCHQSWQLCTTFPTAILIY